MNSADRQIHEGEGKRLGVRGGLGVVGGVVVLTKDGGVASKDVARGRFGSGCLILYRRKWVRDGVDQAGNSGWKMWMLSENWT